MRVLDCPAQLLINHHLINSKYSKLKFVLDGSASQPLKEQSIREVRWATFYPILRGGKYSEGTMGGR